MILSKPDLAFTYFCFPPKRFEIVGGCGLINKSLQNQLQLEAGVNLRIWNAWGCHTSEWWFSDSRVQRLSTTVPWFVWWTPIWWGSNFFEQPAIISNRKVYCISWQILEIGKLHIDKTPNSHFGSSVPCFFFYSSLFVERLWGSVPKIDEPTALKPFGGFPPSCLTRRRSAHKKTKVSLNFSGN